LGVCQKLLWTSPKGCLAVEGMRRARDSKQLAPQRPATLLLPQLQCQSLRLDCKVEGRSCGVPHPALLHSGLTGPG
jgi:hypothetical protein